MKRLYKHSTRVHPDCPLTLEQMDEVRDQLLQVATANACPVHPSWAVGHQRHQARLVAAQGRRLDRLRRLHATALGLYMAARILGRDGEVQRQRMERIGAEIDKYT